MNEISYKKGPFIEFSNNLNRSQILPRDEYLNEWFTLTTIGKIAWFWATINKAAFNDLNEIKNLDKYIFKLEDIDQNYDFYLRLSSKFNFKNIKKKNFIMLSIKHLTKVLLININIKIGII